MRNMKNTKKHTSPDLYKTTPNLLVAWLSHVIMDVKFSNDQTSISNSSIRLGG